MIKEERIHDPHIAQEIAAATAVSQSTFNLIHDWQRSPPDLQKRYELFVHHVSQLDQSAVISLMQSLKAPPVLEHVSKGHMDVKQTELDIAGLRDMLAHYYVDGDYRRDGRERRVYAGDHPPIEPFSKLDFSLVQPNHGVSIWDTSSTRVLGATWVRNAVVVVLENGRDNTVAMVEAYGAVSESQIALLHVANMRRLSRAYLIYGQSSVFLDAITQQLVQSGIVRSDRQPKQIDITSDQFTLILDPDRMEAVVDYHDDAQYERINLHHRAKHSQDKSL